MSSTIGSERNGEDSKGLRTRKRDLKSAGPITLPFAGETGADQAPSRKKAVVKGFGAPKQKEFIDWMMQGASPQVACKKLKVPIAAFWKTLDHDDDFAAEIQQVWDALSFNVVAALYQAAIKGNGTAQQFWLKHRPPPRWANAENSLFDDLEGLSHDELLERARAEAPDLAAEIAARVAAPRGRGPSEAVPAAPDRAGE